MKWLLITPLIVLIITFLWANAAWSKVIEGGPDHLINTRSLGELIAIDDSLHIVFVHGMRSEGAGDSATFREALLRRYPGSAEEGPRRSYIELGTMPIARVGTRRIWENETEWAASRPFLDRYELRLGGRKTVIVDEVNWWPLLFPIKCRMLLVPEHNLSGNDRHHLKLCARHTDGFHPWITETELAALLAGRPRSGGGAWANRWAKREILNWGLADAVIALGPMRAYLVSAMDKAFIIAEAGAKNIAAEDRVVISESLGSFVVLDAYRKAGAIKDYLDQTDHLYFFANQFALLELGRIDLKNSEAFGLNLAPAFESEPETTAVTPLEGLQLWAKRPPSSRAPERSGLAGEGMHSRESSPRQIIAFNDPSDVLTYDVPCMEDIVVVNLYVRNGINWFGLFADPIRAHTGHAGNKSVWSTMLRRSASSPAPLTITTCPR